MTAASKEKVLEALGEAASKLRGELGESLATVQKIRCSARTGHHVFARSLKSVQPWQQSPCRKVFPPHPCLTINAPSSLIRILPWRSGQWATTTSAPANSGEPVSTTPKRSSCANIAARREKLGITADYYQNVTGELDKAARTYQEMIESYPQRVGYGNLGVVLASMGQYEKAKEITREGIRLTPDRLYLYPNVANASLALQRFDEARQIIHEAQARKGDDLVLHNALYALALLGADSAAMAEQQQWYLGKPEEHFGLALASDTEAYGGHLGKARELTNRAVDSAIRADSKENGGIWQAIAAEREAAYGNTARSRQAAANAFKLVPSSQGVEVEAALAFAMAGDSTRAKSLAQDLNKRFSLDTQIQWLWLPAIRAQLALNGKNPALALTTLQAASPIEFGQINFVANISCLYHVYIRGEAYLAAGQSNAAAAEFQKILDHSGIVWNCWTGALAHLGVARANALQSRTSEGADADAARVRALAAYKDFLTLWKDADPDVPILKQAKAEYAKLQ